MKIKNNYTTTIGFGNVVVLPDADAELPRGYNANHPVVKFYLSRGWISIVDGDEQGADGRPPVSVNIQTPGGNGGGNGGDNGDGDNPGDEGDNPDGDNPDGNSGGNGAVASETYISRMNLEQLKAHAAKLGLPVADGDTKKILMDKINAAKAEGGDE